MEDLKPLIAEILDNTKLMSLGTHDEGGVWVSDLIFVYDDNLNIYWLSHESVRHSQAVIKNPSVSATITLDDGAGGTNKGLQVSGRVEKLKGDILEIAILHRKKRNKPAPEKLGEILGAGESWYKLLPEKIELIYEPLFGFKKQVFELINKVQAN